MNWLEEGHKFLEESGLADDIAKAHCEIIRRQIDELKERAGIPRPCPWCGEVVGPTHLMEEGWMVECGSYPHCGYETEPHQNVANAWREHERNCRNAEEAEG